MQHPTHKELLPRLRRIEGQVKGIAGMVEEERYCVDILNQLRAVRAALKKVEDQILHEHVTHCVRHAMESGDVEARQQKVEELIAVFGRYGSP